jgi:prephenate dehydratase
MSSTFSFLGPEGTFTELALAQVPEAAGAVWRAVSHVQDAIDDVLEGRSVGAVIPVENSIEGGVSATLDALAADAKIRIVGEYLVAVTFDLVARPGTALADIHTVATHPVAYAQTRKWLQANLPGHVHLPTTSTAAAAADLVADLEGAGKPGKADAAIAAPSIVRHYPVEVIASNIGENEHAQTRFIQIALDGAAAGNLPAPTGADKTSVIVELPEDRPGALLEMLEQFAARGVNLTRIESRPVGDRLGRYRFNIDAEGHVADAAVSEALKGLHRFSPRVIFLGSYPRADRGTSVHTGNNSDAAFSAAEVWLEGLNGSH